ncbi:MAG: cation transporting ATPase C-terminal domain-containing protein [Parachlamydiaceae bacterium]
MVEAGTKPCIESTDFRGRLLTNRWLFFGLLVGNVLHMGVVFSLRLNRLFHTVRMSISEVFLIGSLASLVLWIEELRKLWVRHTERS